MRVRAAFDQRAHLGVAQLRLRLAFELRIGQADGHDRGESFADVVALERRVLALDEIPILGITVDGLRQRPPEAFDVHATFGRGDAVGERVQAFVVAGVPLPRDLDLTFGTTVAEITDVLEQRLLRLVEMTDEVDDPAVEREVLGLLVPRAFVAQRDRQTTVQKRHHL